MAETTGFIIGMRDAFFDALYPLFEQDKNAIIITADNGAPSLDKFSENLPSQFFNVGIAEQQLIGLAAGMALEGKKVYTYAIAPFVTLRCLEQNKLDMCAMNLPIVNLGVGAGYAYDIMGPSHHTMEDISVMRALPNLEIYSPSDSISAASLAELSFKNPSPQYIRFDRSGLKEIYRDIPPDFSAGLMPIKKGKDICLLATGIMTHQALEVAERLKTQGIDAGIIDILKLKPLNIKNLLDLIRPYKKIVTMEEHLLSGGLGSLIAETFADHSITSPLLRIGQGDHFVFTYGGREAIWEKYGLAAARLAHKVLNWI